MQNLNLIMEQGFCNFSIGLISNTCELLPFGHSNPSHETNYQYIIIINSNYNCFNTKVTICPAIKQLAHPVKYNPQIIVTIRANKSIMEVISGERVEPPLLVPMF